MEILLLLGTLALIGLFFAGIFAVFTRATRGTRDHGRGRDSAA